MVTLGGRKPAGPRTLRADHFRWVARRSRFSNWSSWASWFVLIVGLQLLIQGTKIGRAMRASGPGYEAAEAMGVNADRVFQHRVRLASLFGRREPPFLVGVYYNASMPPRRHGNQLAAASTAVRPISRHSVGHALVGVS